MLTLGISHKTAPVELRERVSYNANSMPEALQDLIRQPAVNEAVIVSTCNRTELYCDNDDVNAMVRWFANYNHINLDVLTPHIYTHQDYNAVRHLMRVASGLDSMVLGEPQILGQIKESYSIAQQVGTIGDHFKHLFPTVFSVTKQVRTDTHIGESPVSIAYVAVDLAKRIFSNLSDHSVLLVGAGETIELAAMHLYSAGVKRIIVANRSLAKAQHLVSKYHGHWIGMGEVPLYLQEADIIITATASPLPILGKGAIETALKIRKHRRMFIVDLAVPRDVEPEVAKLEDVYLYNVDDLEGIIDQNWKHREGASHEAESIISVRAAHFMREHRAMDAVNTVCAFRNQVDHFKNESLQQALTALAKGKPAEEVMAEFAHSLTNKVMHEPTVQMRQAAYDGRHELLALARQLFDLD